MNHVHGAQSAGPSTPTSDETSTAGTVRGLRDLENTTQGEYAAAVADHAIAADKSRQKATSGAQQNRTSGNLGADEADRKCFATLQARAALAGVELSRSTDDHGHEIYVASKWAMTKILVSLAEVADFLARIGGQRAG
jgi:hypothetical protein